MKRSIRFKILAGIAAALCSEKLHAEISPTLISITGINATNQIQLSWAGGRPAYQLQSSFSGTDDWTNMGAPTTNTSTFISASNAQAFFRVVSDFTARYQVVFQATWSAATHPTNWPGGVAHFSGLVGGTHNDAAHFWRENETATEGIRLMAERGQKTTLLNEIAAVIPNGAAHFQLSGGGIAPSPNSVSLTFPQPMHRDFPLVTLVSMIAPSPDWFVGVDSLNMITNNAWITNLTATLYGFDSGTDSGPSYTSADQVTVPRGVISRFTGFPAIQDGVIVPFGTFTFTRLD